MSKKSSLPLMILIIILLTAVTAAATARWTQGAPEITFRAAACIALPFWLLALALWNWGGRGKMLAVLMFIAFVLRLAFGLATVNLLPIYGHPGERREEQGFLFDDAWRRDAEAWAVTH